jgi:hypothetical protein
LIGGGGNYTADGDTAHCDGSYITPDRRERSLLTFHAYLGEDSDENVGGATAFFDAWGRKELEVEPKQGRVLIFQHQWMVHSGEEMVRGLKYTVRTDIMYEAMSEYEELQVDEDVLEEEEE